MKIGYGRRFFVSTDKRAGKRIKAGRVGSSDSFVLDDLVERFITAKVAEGRSEGTLEQYRTNFAFFVAWLERMGVPKDVRHVTADVLRNFTVYMLNGRIRYDGHQFKTDEEKTVGLSPVTANTRLKTLRVFFNYLESEGVLGVNPMAKLKKVTEDDEAVQVLSVDQLRRLLAAPNQRRFSGFRDYVLMHLLLDTMLRINEALSLTVNDVDFATNTITVRGEVAKNRHSRFVPMQKVTAKLVRELVEENKEWNTPWLFVANYGEPLDQNHFRHRLKGYAELAAVTDRRVSPHIFRHTGATLFLQNGGDLRHLQMLLGHRDLRMVLRYTHLDTDALRNQHERYSALTSVLNPANLPRKVLRG
jgi:integrase/recombinase XerD